MPKLVVNNALLDLFAQKRVMLSWNDTPRFAPGDRLDFDPDCRLEAYSQVLEGVCLPRACGAFSYANCQLQPHVEIGRYSSMALSIMWGGSTHPLDWASTSPFSYNPAALPAVRAYRRDRGADYAPEAYDLQRKAIRVGHDVWIGASVMIADGVTIGDGAVIGAKSLVLEDVLPYAVVGGVPARVIRKRFDDATVERMLQVRWWRFGPEELQRSGVPNPVEFLDHLEQRIASGAAVPLQLDCLTGAEMIAAVTQRA